MAILPGIVVAFTLGEGIHKFFRKLSFAEVRKLKKGEVVWVPINHLYKMVWGPPPKYRPQMIRSGHEAMQCVRFEECNVDRKGPTRIATSHGKVWCFDSKAKRLIAIYRPLDEGQLSVALPQIRATYRLKIWEPKKSKRS